MIGSMILTEGAPGHGGPVRRAAAAVCIALGLAAPQDEALAQTGSEQLCTVDASDSAGAPWVRQQRVQDRIAKRCLEGDILMLFPFGSSPHTADVTDIAPLVCRFDSEILLLQHLEGSRRLICVYTGQARGVR